MRNGVRLMCCIFGFLILTGCWNRMELNDLSLVVAMSIDRKEDMYHIAVQVVDPGEVASKKGSSGRVPVTVYSETSDTIFEAVRKITTISPRKLYFSHLQMLILSEAVAKRGISDALEFVSRDHEFREDFYIVVAKKLMAEEILLNLTTIEKIPANKMYSSLATSEKSWAPTVAVQLDELIGSAINSDGRNPVLTGVTIVGDRSKSSLPINVSTTKSYARLHYEGIAVFKKDKLVGWLNEEESKGYNYIVNKVKSTVGDVPCPEDGKVVVEIIRSKPKIKVVYKDGKAYIDIQMFVEANIGEVHCQIDLTKPEAIQQLEMTSAATNKKILELALAKAQEYQTDIFGFGEYIHRSNPQEWKSIKKEWDKIFAQSEVTIHTDFRIRRTGTVNRSFMYKEEEGE